MCPDVIVASAAKLLVEHRGDIIAEGGQSRRDRLREVLVELEFQSGRSPENAAVLLAARF